MATKPVRCPPLPADLIEYLEAVFPDKAVDPAKENPAVHYGSVLVVRHLKAVAKVQEETEYVSTEDA